MRILEFIGHTLGLVLVGAVSMVVLLAAFGFLGLSAMSTALPLGVTGAIIYSVALAMWKALGGTGSKVSRAQRWVDLVLTPFSVAIGVWLANTIVWPFLGTGAGPVTPPEQAFWASAYISVGAALAYAFDTVGNGFKDRRTYQPRRTRRT